MSNTGGESETEKIPKSLLTITSQPNTIQSQQYTNGGQDYPVIVLAECVAHRAPNSEAQSGILDEYKRSWRNFRKPRNVIISPLASDALHPSEVGVSVIPT